MLPDLTTGILLTVAFVCIFFFASIRKYGNNYPPAPFGLPIVGYLPFLTRNVHLKFIELRKKYGEVFSLRLGSVDVVVLSSTNAVKEAFAKPAFLGRPPDNSFSSYEMSSPFFESDMKVWEDQSKYVVKTMKGLGLRKSKIEGQILEEIEHLISVLKSKKGEVLDMKLYLTPSASNNICSMALGHRLDYDHPDRVMIDKNIYSADERVSQAAAQIFLPWLRHIPLVNRIFRMEEILALYKDFKKFMMKNVEEHKKNKNKQADGDFIDSYLVEMEQRQKYDPRTTFTENTLCGSLSDLVGAGTITVAVSLAWCLYVLAGHPDHQRRVVQEISDIIGHDRKPEFCDQKQMPFTQAFLMEVMRWKTTVPLNILRYTLEDTSVCNYRIPKGTTIMVNFWSIHHDPEYWEDPDSFKPERFLSENGDVRKPPSYMPFSIGRRACPGEAMATMEIFLYVVSILQNFDLHLPERATPTYTADLRLVYTLRDGYIRFIDR